MKFKGHPPIPVAARSKAWVCGRSFLGFRVRIPRWHGCMSVVSGVCCQAEFSALGRSLVQRSPTACGVSECDRKTSIMRRPWTARGCYAMERKFILFI
jgi:hypothetical protein